MIKYNLICKCGKTFESWFSSSGEFDVLRKKKLINCIYCDSASVKKTVMAPNLSSKTNKISKNSPLAIKYAIQSIVSGQNHSYYESYEIENNLFSSLFDS